MFQVVAYGIDLSVILNGLVSSLVVAFSNLVGSDCVHLLFVFELMKGFRICLVEQK